MKKEKTKKVIVVSDFQAQQQICINFAYLSYLIISDATVLGDLQLPFIEEPEDELHKLDVVLA
jgi:hypothetical protein